MGCRLNANQVRLYNAGARKRMSRSAAPGRTGRRVGADLVYKHEIDGRGRGRRLCSSREAWEGVDNAADCGRRTSPSLRSSKETTRQKVEAAQFLRENQRLLTRNKGPLHGAKIQRRNTHCPSAVLSGRPFGGRLYKQIFSPLRQSSVEFGEVLSSCCGVICHVARWSSKRYTPHSCAHP